jgi:CRISPR/Cas system-associated exonuclease Cas4 (RecB family)
MNNRASGADSDERVFLFPPSINLMEETADRLICSGLDYSCNLVVFPGKRPAHFLRDIIARREKSSYIPPVILSIEEFVDRTYERILPHPLAKLETVDAVAFLFQLHRAMEKPLGGKEFLSPERFFPLALRIYRDLEELLMENVELDRLRSLEGCVESPIPRETNAGLQSLSFFYERFYTALEDKGSSSRSQRYRFVASGISRETVAYKRIIFAGFYALTEAERRIFKEVLSWEHSFFLFQDGPGIEQGMKSLGIGHVNLSGTVEDRRPEIAFYKSPDSHGQVFSLSALFKDRITEGEKRFGTETVIVLPASETLFPLLHHSLPLVPDGEYNVSLGYPLGRTPTWGFLNNLLQLIMSMDGDRLYIPDYLRFVLHPYTKNIYMKGKTEPTRLLFHTIEELLLEDRARSFIGLDEIEGKSRLCSIVRERISTVEDPPDSGELADHLKAIHDSLIRSCYMFQNVRDFAGKMMNVLFFIYERSSARLHPFFHPFAESFVKELDLLAKSLIGDFSFQERNSYFHFLRSYVAHCFTPFEGTPLKGMQVLGFLETRNLRFDHVYILDANEDVIPDTRKEETLLPFKVRQFLGMSTYIDRDRLQAYYFHTLVRGSLKTDIFFIESARKEKSRFAEKLLWEEQRKSGLENGSELLRSVVYRASLENREPQSVAKTGPVADFLGSRTYDATSLDVYLKCPLQFYYRYVLALESKEKMGWVAEKVDIGRLVHKILFTYFKGRKDAVLNEDVIDFGEMNRVVEYLFTETFGPDPIGQTYLLKRQVSRQMLSFLRHYQLPVVRSAPVSILHLEYGLQAAEGPFRLRGIIDRIEMRGEKTFIIDYKTSFSPARLSIDFERLDTAERSTWRESIGTLQLPFYLLLMEKGGRQVQNMAAVFLLLGKAHLDDKVEMALFKKEEDVIANYEKAKEIIIRLMSEIADSRIPFTPTSQPKESCTFCDYRYICGTQWHGKG